AYQEIYSLRVAYGRFFTEGDVEGRRRVVVLGADIPEGLATPAPLLVGRTVRTGGEPFEVVGALEPRGDMGGLNQPDRTAYIPLSTLQARLFGGRDRLRSIVAKVNGGPGAMDEAYALIDPILRREHRILPGAEADFTIRNATD